MDSDSSLPMAAATMARTPRIVVSSVTTASVGPPATVEEQKQDMVSSPSRLVRFGRGRERGSVCAACGMWCAGNSVGRLWGGVAAGAGLG